MKSLQNLRKFMNNPIAFLDECHAKAPELKVQKHKLGPKSFVMIFDPDLSHEVLSERHETFIQNRTIFDRIKPITGVQGLVQLNGKASVQARSSFAPMFSAANMIKMKEAISQNTQAALAETVDSEAFDVTSFMADLVLRNAFKMFLGIEMKGKTNSIAEDFQELNALCGGRMVSLLPVPMVIPTRTNRRIKNLRANLRHQISEVIKSQQSSDTVNIPTLFGHDEFMIDQCMTFLFAGHETTASSLSFTLLLLGQNPQYIDAIKNGDDGLALKVYKEALRLFPPAYMLAREANVDCELDGVKIRKGTQVIIGVKQLHYHESFHKEPLAFRPERFSGASQAFLPFGAGPKNCIGEGIAYMEALTIIKLFCRAFDFETLNPSIQSRPLVTLHPLPGQFLKVRKV